MEDFEDWPFISFTSTHDVAGSIIVKYNSYILTFGVLQVRVPIMSASTLFQCSDIYAYFSGKWPYFLLTPLFLRQWYHVFHGLHIFTKICPSQMLY
jgi:hypothetical protein